MNSNAPRTPTVHQTEQDRQGVHYRHCQCGAFYYAVPSGKDLYFYTDGLRRLVHICTNQDCRVLLDATTTRAMPPNGSTKYSHAPKVHISHNIKNPEHVATCLSCQAQMELDAIDARDAWYDAQHPF